MQKVQRKYSRWYLAFLRQTDNNLDMEVSNDAAHSLNEDCWQTRLLLLKGIDRATTPAVKLGARDVYIDLYGHRQIVAERALVESKVWAPPGQAVP